MNNDDGDCSDRCSTICFDQNSEPSVFHVHCSTIVSMGLCSFMQAINDECKGMSDHVPRRIPVSWYGAACEVRLMGDFDGWTRGQELSPEVIEDSVLTEYVAELELLPVGHAVESPLQMALEASGEVLRHFFY